MGRKFKFFIVIFLAGSCFFSLFAPVSRAQQISLNASAFSRLSLSQRQFLIAYISEQLRLLTAELAELIASLPPGSNHSANPTNNSSGNNSGSNSNSGSGGSLGGAGINQPFGGKSTQVTVCTCGDNYLIDINPAQPGLPDELMLEPNSLSYLCHQEKKAGQYLLGTWLGQDNCYVWKGQHCDLVGTGKRIVMVGSSGCEVDNLGGQPGGGGGGPNPTSQPLPSYSPAPTLPPDQCKRMGNQVYSYPARGTGYYPSNSAMEGGFEDMHGNPLRTLQDYLEGRADYVSTAMDSRDFPYGTELCIPELDQKYGRQIIFRVVDTGGAFAGMGTSRIDICTRDAQASTDGTINGSLNLVSSIPSLR